MTVQREYERETTFDVPTVWQLPDLTAIGLQAAEPTTVELRATYFDSGDAVLRRLGVILRHRDGGDDAGWHLKLPSGKGRGELRSQASGTGVPESVVRRVEGVLAGRDLVPVVIITTVRRTTRLLDGSGAVAAEVADDDVSAASLGDSSTLVSWHEVEVELGSAGEEATLHKITKQLRRSGATVSQEQMKINRALGGLTSADLPEQDSAAAARYLRAQCAAILLGDIGLRDEPSSAAVHKARVGIRRLRSVVRSLSLSPSAGEQDDLARLDGDLRWLAELLGRIRDVDIMARRAVAMLHELPTDQVLGPITREVEERIAVDRRSAVDRLRSAWTDERYKRTLAAVAAFHAAVPITDPARTKALRKAQRRLDRRLSHAGDDPAALHAARRAAKRLRYTAELLVPVRPKAKATVKQAKRLQSVLGDHQDLIVTAAFLRQLAMENGAAAGHNGFTYGVLHAQALAEAARLRDRIKR